ncbi:flagellar protein FlgN [Bacillus sp. FJAT-45066]|uniref:flagellar protein FlgN n=1 Tax=Bacillus sp. FJAT-45066 TaxID=2011010 RepID=UPI00159696CD|nr:flagellar protein FlgN [Bacillus sp. FJAT-45066]
MSIQNITILLEKILTLHQRLLEQAVTKAELIKSGNPDELQSLLKEEQKLVQAIGQLETERLKLMPNADGTITTLIESTSGSNTNKLAQLKDELTSIVLQLKEQNELNQQLLQQSLQFINVTMNALQGPETQVTYDKPTAKKAPTTSSRSIFDSKA